MFKWYRETAPIRQKLYVTFCVMTGLVVLATIGASLASYLVGPLAGLAWGALIAVCTAILGATFRSAIADPYVTTVVRMEALAAGDLTSPIEFINYGDCVGRLTKAMFTFRDAAQAQIDRAAEQGRVVETLGNSLAKLSERDLTFRITEDFAGSFEVLKNNYNEALDRVRTTVQRVSESASMIQTGSTEIARASQDLARRTEANAASLEQTSAALVQIDSRIKATAAASASTVARADQAMQTVGSGRSTADAAKQAMDRVSGSAKGIDSVIEGLDKIAFQTRVLAMNAAVEAGRAGDAGRGFAVVADLVSALAMRAEEEAKRAREQLTMTQSEIITAAGAVELVDAALEKITGDVDAVNTLVASIASDNEAQSSAISEITAAVASMDRSTQQNAAMVEETSAAASNLTTEIASLADAAAQFKFERRVRDMPVAFDRRAGDRRASAPPLLSHRSASPVPARAVARISRVASSGPANDHVEGGTGQWAHF